MTVKEQHLEGQLRFVNSRVITNAEEISFYQGNKREQITIRETLDRLVQHLRTSIMFRFSMGFIDGLIAKCELMYCSPAMGYKTREAVIRGGSASLVA